DKPSDRVPCLTDTVIVNRLDNELHRLSRSRPNTIPNITDSVNRRLEPAPNLVKATPNSVEHVFFNPHPNSVKMIPKPVPQVRNPSHNILEEGAQVFKRELKSVNDRVADCVPHGEKHVL